MENHSLTDEQTFLIKFATIAYGYGVLVYHLESYLKGIATNFGVNLEMVSNGNVVQFVFGNDLTGQHSYFVRLPAANFDMTKIILIQNLADSIIAGDISVTDGITRLSEIEKKPARYGPLLNALAFGLVGASVAVIFSSPWMDVILGGVLGIVVYGIVMLAGRLPWVGRSLEFLSAFVSALLAAGLASLFPGSNPYVLVICAVAVFLPGFPLILGLDEILLHYTVSGFNRLVDSIVIVAKLFAGALVGGAIASLFLIVPPPAPPAAISTLVLWMFIVVLYLGIVLVFQVRLEDFGWVILVGLLTYIAMTVGNLAGFWQGPFLGAFVLGILGNIFARWRKLPATIVTLPGIMALTPGVVAYIGLFNVTSSGLEAISTAAWQIFVTFIALVIGFVVANTIVAPKTGTL